jgi:hypothetical protein
MEVRTKAAQVEVWSNANTKVWKRRRFDDQTCWNAL